jgi:N-acyl amino acid synthase of PEP-CTERM/exosortase system
LASEKQSFDNCFEVFLADTPESRQIHYNLRYQVYCEEMGFEDKTQYPDEMEYDEWDDKAVHFLVRHKLSGHWLGGLRLVFNENGPLPFERHSTSHQHISSPQRKISVEMSRLCVIKEARRFSSKRFAPYGLPDQEIAAESDKVRSFYNFKNQTRSMIWGLFKAAVDYSAENNLDYWYFIVAPALAYFIRREGFELSQIGEPCDHKGVRTPYKIAVNNILQNPLWLTDYKNDFFRYSDVFKARTGKQKMA